MPRCISRMRGRFGGSWRCSRASLAGWCGSRAVALLRLRNRVSAHFRAGSVVPSFLAGKDVGSHSFAALRAGSERSARNARVAKNLLLGRSGPDHLASGALAPSSAPFESTHNSRTPGDHVTDSRSSIAALSDQLADAVAVASASVVAVHARPRLPSTGVHWKDGVVVTTDGTVKQEEDIAVTLPPPDGRRIPATFAGRDRGTDLAVLRIPPGSLPVAELGDPAVLRPGNL